MHVHPRALLIALAALIAVAAAGCRLIGAGTEALPGPKPIYLWCDATANLDRLDSPEGVADVIAKAVDVGVTALIVDVKPISGHVLTRSDFARRLTRWPQRGDPQTMLTPALEFDVLDEMCRQGHAAGLTVFAAMNVFAEGHKQIAGLEGAERGRVFDDKRDWTAWDLMVRPGADRPSLGPTTDHARSYTAFVSPFHPEVRAHELNLIREVVARYPIDGIALDRVRFDGFQSDFSPWAHHAFEEFLGREIPNWPEAVMTRGAPTDDEPLGVIRHGRLWEQWQRFRAQTIHDFMEEAREHVQMTNPDCLFTTYVGAWYPLYADVGVNWASPRFDPRDRWPGFPPDWNRAGYAPLLDLLFVGTYFYAVAPEEVGGRADGRTDAWLSVEGSADVAVEVVMGECPVIGSLYVEQYLFESPTGEFDREQFARALRAAYDHTDGLMIFDLVHLEMQGAWDVVRDFAASRCGAPSSAALAASER